MSCRVSGNRVERLAWFERAADCVRGQPQLLPGARREPAGRGAALAGWRNSGPDASGGVIRLWSLPSASGPVDRTFARFTRERLSRCCRGLAAAA
jgi:hypothetical protein